MAALAWAGLGLFKTVVRMNLMAVGGTRGGGVTLTDPALVVPILAAHDMPCSRCGYSLRGLQGGSCPECREPIVLSIAGADPLRPIVWLTRLAVGVYLLHTAQSAIAVWFIVANWGLYFSGSGFGGPPLRFQIGLIARPGVSLVGFVLLGVLVFKWATAEGGRPRAIARWRVLNAAVALVGLVALAELIGWALRM